MAELDNPRNAPITVAVLITILGIIVLVIGVDQYYRFAIHDAYAEKVLARENPQLMELRARERFQLENYSWVDKEKGQVAIPLERARELVLKEWTARPGGLVPGSAASTAPVEGGQAPSNGQAPAGDGQPPAGGSKG